MDLQTDMTWLYHASLPIGTLYIVATSVRISAGPVRITRLVCIRVRGPRLHLPRHRVLLPAHRVPDRDCGTFPFTETRTPIESVPRICHVWCRGYARRYHRTSRAFRLPPINTTFDTLTKGMSTYFACVLHPSSRILIICDKHSIRGQRNKNKNSTHFGGVSYPSSRILIFCWQSPHP